MTKIILGILLFFNLYPATPSLNFESLKICQNSYISNPKDAGECFKKYFSDFTYKHGRENTILAFQNLTQKDDSLIEHCHYIMHGVGHGTLLNLQKNIVSAFSLSLESPLMSTLPPTCGSGYFHGLIEEYVGTTTEINIMKNKLISICMNSNVIKNNNQIDCYHGIGHAVFLYLEGNVKPSLNLCEDITRDEKMQSMCRTGVFMEMLRPEEARNNKKILSFSACENLSEKYQGECFNQQSYLLAEFGTKKKEFNQNIKACNLKFPRKLEERISCIRMFNF